MSMRVFALVAAIAMVLVGCGESSATEVASAEDTETTIADDVASLGGEGDGETSTPEEVDAEAAMLEFAQCLRDQGIDVEDPTVDADGNVLPPRPAGGFDDIDREALGTAQQECAHLLEGVSLGFADIDQTELQDQLVEFTACLRDQGLDVDDPNFSEGGFGGRTILGDLNPDDPEVAEALDACSDVLGAFGFGQGGGRGGNQGGN